MLNRATELKRMYKKRSIWKLIDQVVEIIKQSETESELSKELLGNFQAENLYNHH